MNMQFGGIFEIFVVILVGESVSSVLDGNKSSTLVPHCSEKVHVNMGHESETPVADVDMTATFQVGLAEDHSIIGRIEWILHEVSDTTPMVAKVMTFVDGSVEVEDCYLLYVDDEEKENTDRRYAYTNCIGIPPSVNTTIKAEVRRINSTSCDCDVINMATRNYCLKFCQFDFISSYNFQASKDACVLYRKSYQDDLTMNLMGEMISNEVTRFNGYFSNVNPYSSARVSLFPDDELHYPHVPIITFQAKIEQNGDIYFSVDTENMGYFDFYTKLQVTCSNEHISVDYISESLKIKPFVEENYTDESDVYRYDDKGANESGKSGKQKKTEVLYGVIIGILVLACIITVTVWVLVGRRKKRRSEMSSRHEGDKDLHIQLCSPTTVNAGKTNASGMNNCSEMTTKTKEVMMLMHPDTVEHENDVEDLVTCLRKYDIHAHNRPEVQFQNWRDFAEKAGGDYTDIVIVLSRGLVELCEIYKSKGRTVNVMIEEDTETDEYRDKHTRDKRWNKLLLQRNGEYIPCVVLDTIRSVVQDKWVEVGIHLVTFCDTNEISTFDGCDENKLNSKANMTFKHFIDICPNSKHNQLDHHYLEQEKEETRNYVQQQYGNDDQSHEVENHTHTKSYTTGMLEYFLKSRDQDYVWKFMERNTFLQTKNTYFHTISRNVLRYLLLSDTENDNDANSLSLITILKDKR